VSVQDVATSEAARIRDALTQLATDKQVTLLGALRWHQRFGQGDGPETE